MGYFPLSKLPSITIEPTQHLPNSNEHVVRANASQCCSAERERKLRLLVEHKARTQDGQFLKAYLLA